MGAAVGPVQAQTTSDQIPTRSFITPFPEDDVYDVKIYGDSWADGLLNAANRILAKDARLRINRKVQKLNGITSSRWDRAVRAVDGLSETNVPEIAIVMAGAFDQSPIRQANGRRIRLRDQAAWQAGYAERVERILRAFATKRVAVYWIGQPITRGARRRAHANLINEIVRSAARRSRVKFIDTYDMFADEAGGYSDYGADLEDRNFREF
ncbi:MAG: GDSL-type esterase/lipase family protein, partial [Pseudomonadota bacterium]